MFPQTLKPGTNNAIYLWPASVGRLEDAGRRMLQGIERRSDRDGLKGEEDMATGRRKLVGSWLGKWTTRNKALQLKGFQPRSVVRQRSDDDDAYFIINK